jgi:hypothetical protein
MLNNDLCRKDGDDGALHADVGQQAASANSSELYTPSSAPDKCPWDYSIVTRVRSAGGPVDILAIAGYSGQPCNWQLVDLETSSIVHAETLEEAFNRLTPLRALHLKLLPTSSASVEDGDTTYGVRAWLNALYEAATPVPVEAFASYALRVYTVPL